MRILIGTDGSEPSQRALELGAKLKRELKCDLTIIHVANADELAWNWQTDEYNSREERTIDARLSVISEQTLNVARQWAEEFGISDFELEKKTGDVAVSIIDTANRVKADMIIVGKRGRGRLVGLLLGSVSQKLVSLAPCAVVVVP